MATSTLGNGTLVLAGTTSGTTTVTATAVAGTTTLTLPAATDTLVGKATTDTLTNKTLTGAVMNGTLGATTPSTVAATTLTTSSTVTHNGGTANGVAYLDGSKVLTTGSALVFDGTNLGVGVTPSAFGGGYKAFEVNAGSISATTGVGNLIVSNNSYFNGTNFIYKATGVASDHVQTGGQHWFRTAPSGTAGNPISFTQAMTLDASGRLLLGPTSGTGMSANDLGMVNGGSIRFRNAANSAWLNMINVDSSNNLNFGVGGVPTTITFGISGIGEAGRFDTSGNLLVGTTSTTVGGGGSGVFGFRVDGANGIVQSAASGNASAIFNRTTNDGTIVSLRQDGTEEGTISVSGTTVSYNGGHLSRYAQTTTAKDDTLVKGTVLSNLDEMNVYTKDGQPVANEQLNKVKVSDTEGDINVAGVFVNWSHDEDHNVDEINMAMTGDMIIRIAQGVTVARGDLLMSAGNGTAKPQGDDIVRSKTVAKVTSTHVTCTYPDGSFCVPCVLMAC
jgi:hypothetical protein